jgi:hypothetical protein
MRLRMLRVKHCGGQQTTDWEGAVIASAIGTGITPASQRFNLVRARAVLTSSLGCVSAAGMGDFRNCDIILLIQALDTVPMS